MSEPTYGVWPPAFHGDARVRLNAALVVVRHGADAGVARPSGAEAVYWIGTVEPANALDGDFFKNTT